MHLEWSCHSLFRSDYPSNNKREGVCISYEPTLLWIFQISMNVSTLRSVLPAKFATSSSSIEINLDALSTNNCSVTVMIGN